MDAPPAAWGAALEGAAQGGRQASDNESSDASSSSSYDDDDDAPTVAFCSMDALERLTSCFAYNQQPSPHALSTCGTCATVEVGADRRARKTADLEQRPKAAKSARGAARILVLGDRRSRTSALIRAWAAHDATAYACSTSPSSPPKPSL